MKMKLFTCLEFAFFLVSCSVGAQAWAACVVPKVNNACCNYTIEDQYNKLNVNYYAADQYFTNETAARKFVSGLVAKMMGFIKLGQPDGTQVSLKAWLYAPLKSLALAPVQASLLFAILFNLLMFALAWVMWRKSWFVKV